jgi:molybdate transport system substrate-binding protein
VDAAVPGNFAVAWRPAASEKGIPDCMTRFSRCCFRSAQPPVPGASGRRRWLFLMAAGLATGCRRNPDPRFMVACAASLRGFMEEAMPVFASRLPGCEMRTVYGASGSLVSQVRGKAPFSMLLAADMDGPAALAADGLTGPPFRYANGSLALWTGTSVDPGKDGLMCLLAPSVRKIALANPATAPYGRAAMEALQCSSLADAIRPRLVYGASVSEAAHFVRSGAADAGFVSASLCWPDGRVWAVPPALHRPIQHAGVIIPWGECQREAAVFRDWLLSDESAAMRKRHGLSTPGRA